MIGSVQKAAKAVELMDEYLRKNLPKERLWTSYTPAEKRKRGEQFSLQEHVRGMVLAMLSGERRWDGIDSNMKQIERIFFGFDPERLMAEPCEALEEAVRQISCGNRRIKFQMQALKPNIEKLKSFEEQHGSVDAFFQKLIDQDASLKSLVKALSGSQSKDKLLELGVPLVSEYLRHVGYNVPKPDRHIRRILGSKRLACSKKEFVSEFEVFDIIAELAKETNKTGAEVDYILWSYCADGYGAICTESPKCSECVAKAFCNAEG